MFMRRVSFAALAAALAATPVAAQSQSGNGSDTGSDQADRFGDVIELRSWNYEAVAAEGWSADALLDEDAYDTTGEDIGEVEDLIFDGDGRLIAVVAEVGGFWDIGDTHVAIPWSDVQVAANGDGVVLPVTEENIETFDLFANSSVMPRDRLGSEVVAGVDDAMAPGDTWRLREFIGDYVRLLDGDEWVNYGYVTDVIVRDGEIAATLVGASGAYGYGMYGYPTYARWNAGWDSRSPYYDMPYSPEDIDDLEPIERNVN